mgnify:CR=1 FL=1
MRGNYSKYPPHTHNDYEEEFFGGFKTLHREHYFYNLGFGDGSPIGNTGLSFHTITGDILEHKEREIKEIENTLKLHEGSDVHFEGSDDFESFKKGDIFVFTWSSYDNCFLCFKHTPTTTKHTEHTSSSNWVGYHLTK